jgi:RimJ/RimL family protein N-acetyltransferase
MKPGTIVYSGKTEKGTDVSIRYPKLSDAAEMLRYINTLSKEETFILFQGEQLTLSEETKFVRMLLKKIKNNKVVTLLAFHENVLIGNSGITMKEKAEKHVGDFGISIAKEFRGQGIGKLLMKFVLEEGEKYLENFEICTLGCFSDNTCAMEMYKKFGFQLFGSLPKGIRHKDVYVDHIFMYKTMNSVHEKT